MEIYWHGQACFEIRTASIDAKKKTRIVIDPYGKQTGLKLPSLRADLLLITHDHEDHNNEKVVKDSPFVIKEAGEYEVKEVFVKGVSASHGTYEKKDLGKTLIYIIETEGISLCHLGDLGQEELSSQQLETIGDVDILMIPVGGKYTIDAEGAQKIANQIEPKIIIPMHYKIANLKFELDKVDEFLKTMGQENIKEEEVLKIKANALPSETKIIVLKP
ncbi:hypothetical protein B6D52_03615 [Candidatus Parcubacteria bacterium 4484_255]|nr:MAG: hypothetical protein B6D52_03615 [Candidatus Parcubacteria bacterium 4484_255]